MSKQLAQTTKATMKFSLLTVLAASVAAPATAEIYLKEQFDDVSSRKVSLLLCFY